MHVYTLLSYYLWLHRSQHVSMYCQTAVISLECSTPGCDKHLTYNTTVVQKTYSAIERNGHSWLGNITTLKFQLYCHRSISDQQFPDDRPRNVTDRPESHLENKVLHVIYYNAHKPLLICSGSSLLLLILKHKEEYSLELTGR